MKKKCNVNNREEDEGEEDRDNSREGVPRGKRAVATVVDLVADVGDGAGTHALNARHVDPGAQELLVDLEAHGVTRALRHSLACCGGRYND